MRPISQANKRAVTAKSESETSDFDNVCSV